MHEKDHSPLGTNEQEKTKNIEPESPTQTPPKTDNVSAAKTSKGAKGQDKKEALSKQMEKLHKELKQKTHLQKELEAEVLRLVAEIQTLRRRAAADVQKARQDGIAELALALTETVDNLERALTTMETQQVPQAARQGVQLTYESLLRCLKKFNIQRIEPLGEEFNPEYHAAIERIQKEGAKANQVVEVVQIGYQMGNGKLIRPAMVKVTE